MSNSYCNELIDKFENYYKENANKINIHIFKQNNILFQNNINKQFNSLNLLFLF